MTVSIYLWILWYAYWLASARNRVRNTKDAPAKSESWSGRIGYTLLMAVGFGMLFSRNLPPYLGRALWNPSAASVGLGLAIQTVGLAFAVWARHILGSNWAARVTIGARQELIIRGPYRLVRHPIYTGLLVGVLGTTIIVGSVRAFLGLLLVFTSVLIKLRREESALRGHFGERYEQYARQVPALVPWTK